MSGPGPRFVNNQFNSPIKLYSPQSIQETLDRQTQILANGAIGIDFNQLAKPANLQNSAVLRMLEEEEIRKRNGQQPNLKRVAWPPPPEDQDIDEYIEQGPVQAKTRGIGEYASYQSSPSPQNFPQTTPAPVSPGGTLRQPSHFQQQKSAKGWAPVTPPATSPLPQTILQPPVWNQPQQSPTHLQTQSSVDRTRQPYSSPVSTFEAPPSTITLRPEPPISQDEKLIAVVMNLIENMSFLNRV